MNRPINIVALEPVTRALEDLDVTYQIGESLASSFHGIPRSTVDVDLIADLRLDQVASLVVRLQPDYYVDADMITDAIRRRSSFTVIRNETSYEVDVFILNRSAFDQAGWKRTVQGALPDGGTRQYPLVSAEDDILNKLEWFRKGGEVSERQRLDVMRVMKVQHDRLDLPYLRRWADDLQVRDLLEKALIEAGAVRQQGS